MAGLNRSLLRLAQINKHLAYSDIDYVTTSSHDTNSGISKEAQAVLDTRKSMRVLDSSMSYLDTLKGEEVVLFLHGNPTAAFLWRNIIPHVQPVARCVAPDLIGMGHSDKPNITYYYREHYKYLSQWIEQMNFPKKITLVVHDWGSGLGLHWCNQHRDRVKAIVYMEAMVSTIPSWDLFPEMGKKIFQTLRSDAGEELVLKNNFFVERMLFGSIMRELSEDEKKEYRAPYQTEKSRLPTLTWPREIPIDTDGPDDVVKLVKDYRTWLSTDSSVPKLYIHSDPGFFSKGIKMAVESWPNQKIVTVKGLHFLQEDSPDEIGQAIREFLSGIK